MSISPFVLVVHPSVPAKTVQELIALAKSKPGQLNYASSGIGTPPHLAGELFKAMAGIDIVHVVPSLVARRLCSGALVDVSDRPRSDAVGLTDRLFTGPDEMVK